MIKDYDHGVRVLEFVCELEDNPSFAFPLEHASIEIAKELLNWDSADEGEIDYEESNTASGVAESKAFLIPVIAEVFVKWLVKDNISVPE